MKYIIYCRKSSDSEDRQLLSLDAQERELLNIAKKNNLKTVKIFRESMSAKSAGRPIFNNMMKMIETGKAEAILCWKLDRLARNFIDGGKVIDSLQKSIVKEIRTHETIYLPTDNVLLLAVQLGMANQYIRDLSENVKRGNREKLARGEWPNHAPFGYLNDKATKTIVIDPKNSIYVPKVFELYLTGSYSLKDISDLLYKDGLRTSSGKKVFRSHIQRILNCVFYTGLMEREGKYYQGKHKPLISKEIFERAQDLMHDRSRPRPQKLFFPLRGFLKCANCNCALTASLKKGHHYYYCTNGKQKCNEHKTYMREKYLYEVVAELFEGISFSERKIELMYKAAKEQAGSDFDYMEQVRNNHQIRLKALSEAENKLLDVFLEGNVDKTTYEEKVKKLKNERTSLNQQIKSLESHQPAFTLEPTKKLFLQASRAKKEFLEAGDTKKREIVENLLWNLFLKNRNVASVSFKQPFQIMFNAPKNASFSTMLPD